MKVKEKQVSLFCCTEHGTRVVRRLLRAALSALLIVLLPLHFKVSLPTIMITRICKSET